MMSMMKKRAMAISLALALLTVAFAGLFFVEGAENPTTLSVDVTAGPIYVGDTVTFNLTGWAYEWDWETDFAVELYINDVMFDGDGAYPMYNTSHDYFEWMWPAVAGDFDWKVMVTNNTDSMEWNTTGMFHVYAYPAFIGDGNDIAMTEDMDMVVELPMQFSGEGLTFTDDTMTVHENLTAVIDDDDNLTVTPAAEWSGTEMVKIFATDMNGMEVNNTFTFVVAAEDDAPVIIGIDFMDETLVPEEMNVTVGWNETTGEPNMWEMVWAIQLDIEEDAMDINFTVNATDVDSMDLTYEWTKLGDMDPYDVVAWEDFPEMFNFTTDPDAFGLWEANLTVSDGEKDTIQLVWFNVMAENDAPTGEFVTTMPTNNTFEIETDTNLTVMVSVADVDDTNLTVVWKIDTVTAQESNMTSFTHMWDMAGTYNITVYVDDGVNDAVMIGYYLAMVSEPGTMWTADDIVVDYTEAAGDVVVAKQAGILDFTYSDLKLTTSYKMIDITGIATALDGDNLMVTITFAEAPLQSMSVDGLVTKTPYYSLYFVKSTFTEPKLDQASPNMNYVPAAADVYPITPMDYEFSGMDMVYTIALSDLDEAGVTPADFNIFFVASILHSNVLDFEKALDSAGFHAATHIEPATDDDVADDDDDDSTVTIVVIVIIVVVVLLAIILIIVFLMRGKKGEEEEVPVEGEMPPEEGEMPMEGAEMPMEEEQPPMEGYEQPPEEPMPEESVPEEPVPEEPVPEEPVPEEPVPETPPAPQPPVPPAPAPPQPPQ